MTPSEYIELASRTNAPTDKAIERFNKLNHEELKKLLEEYVEIGNKLDKVKKAIFYGKNYSEATVGVSQELVNRVDNRKIELFHSILGTATESSELVEAFLKFMNGNELDGINVIEEYSDVLWYISIAHKELQVSIESTMEKNINKLRARYPNKFTEEKAINRDLVTERKILES